MRNSSGMKGGFLSPERFDQPSQVPQSQRQPTGEKEKKFNMTTITPTTIKYVMDSLSTSADESIMMDGVTLDHFSICGRVLQILEEANRITILIDDATGRLSFYIYMRSKSELPAFYQKANIKENSYIKAILMITNYQESKIFFCTHLTEIVNFNEISLHILSTIQTHLHRRRGYLKSYDEGNKENSNTSDTKVANRKSDNFSGAYGVDAKMKNILEKASNLNEKIYEICKILAEKHDKPITLDDILKITRSKFEERAIS